jgi:hypothetical protein
MLRLVSRLGLDLRCGEKCVRPSSLVSKHRTYDYFLLFSQSTTLSFHSLSLARISSLPSSISLTSHSHSHPIQTSRHFNPSPSFNFLQSLPTLPRHKTTRSSTDLDAITQLYQKKTPIEHVLLRPDSYVGSTQLHELTTWVVTPSIFAQTPTQHTNLQPTDQLEENTNQIIKENIQMELKKLNYIPALLKIFDEILINASDNKQRDNTMKSLSVNININNNIISITNDGQCIPPIIHPQENMYIPQLIFGHLLTGSNFDDTVLKVTGGRNGYGAKLTNIFSNLFEIEIADQVCVELSGCIEERRGEERRGEEKESEGESLKMK